MSTYERCRLCKITVGNIDEHLFKSHPPKVLDILDGIQHLISEDDIEDINIKEEPLEETVQVDESLNVKFEEFGAISKYEEQERELEKIRFENSKLKSELQKFKQTYIREIKSLQLESSSLKESFKTMKLFCKKLPKTQSKLKRLKRNMKKMASELQNSGLTNNSDNSSFDALKEEKDYKVLITKDVKIKLQKLKM